MKHKNVLIISLALLGLGGWMQHVSVHPSVREGVFTPLFVAPALVGVLDVVVVPVLFLSKKTAPWGYLLNGMFVLLGTILMLHFPFLAGKPPASAVSFLLNTPLRDVVILWGDFLVGAALYRMVMVE
jgi:hypothetical protein